MLVSKKKEDHRLYLLGLDYITQIKLTVEPDSKGVVNLNFESL